MSKILLEIYLPANLSCFEVVVPSEGTLHQLTPLISQALAQLTPGKYLPDNQPILCDYQTGNILDINMGLRELGLRNGSRLILI